MRGFSAILMALGCLLYLALPLVIGFVVVQPLHERSKGNEAVIRRYSLFDFLALAVQLQVALALCVASFRRASMDGTLYIIGFLLLFAVLAIWWAGVEVAVRANVVNAWRRAAIHLLLLPGVAALMVMTVIAIGAISDYLFWAFNGETMWADADRGGFYTLLLATSTAVVTVVLRQVAAWIARGSSAPLDATLPPAP